MVTGGRFLLFVTLFMFLIDNDQPEILEREEDAGAHTEDELVGSFGGLPFIDIKSLDVGKLGMIDSHAVAKEMVETLGDLGGEGYFGQEVEHLLAFSQVVVDEVNVNLSLSRRSDPVKKGDVLGKEGGLNFRKGFLLRRIERVAWTGVVGSGCCFSASSDASRFFQRRLVLRLHGARQRRLHHIAERTEVVVGNPLPEGELLLVHDGVIVEHLYDGFDFHSLGRVVVGVEHHACIDFVLTKGHNNSTASHHSSFHVRRNEVCEAVEWYRECDVCKHQLEEVSQRNLVSVVLEFTFDGRFTYTPDACLCCVAKCDVVVIAYTYVAPHPTFQLNCDFFSSQPSSTSPRVQWRSPMFQEN